MRNARRNDGAQLTLQFRRTEPNDVEGCFLVREQTRENAISREVLEGIGITLASVTRGLTSGEIESWVCASGSTILGFCSGDSATGEVLVLAVAPEAEGKGIGKRLLEEVVRELRAKGHGTLRLAASANPADRSHGFYRSQGWKASGEKDAVGDEILLLDAES